MCVCVCVRIVQKALSLTPKKLGKENSFPLYFNVIKLDINALHLVMQSHQRRKWHPGPLKTPPHHICLDDYFQNHDHSDGI